MKASIVRLGRFTAAVTALALAACGGGGGIDGTGASPAGPGSTGPTGPGGSIDGTGMAYGTITAFGSVWVNGVEFSTNGTTIKFDDRSVSQADLRVGMVVRVDGSIDDRKANTILVDDSLKGRVEQVLDTNRMIVLGQTVLIDGQTRFDNGARPSVGDYVEVHGLPVADGTLAASYIEKKATLASPPFVVKGFVKNHDSAARTFSVGNLTVQYAGATTGDMAAGSWNGLLVDVKGSACAGNPVCGTLTGTKVEPGGSQVGSAAKSEVEGFVSRLTTDGFVLGGQTVVLTASTVFEGGLRGDVLVGTKLEAEGPISNGVLTATKVSLRDSIRLEGDVAGVDTAAGTLTLAGLPGITVQVNSLTALDKIASAASLGIGNHLRIRGRPLPGTGVQALELELRSAASSSRVELRGPVSAVAGTTSVTILGVAVDTSGISDNNFKNHHDTTIGRAAFFAAVSAGTVVKARGDRSGPGVTWSEMELERD